jgi:hypothetical protein
MTRSDLPLDADREFARGFVARLERREREGAANSSPPLPTALQKSLDAYVAGLADAVAEARARGLEVPEPHELARLFTDPENYEDFGHDMPSWLIGWLTGFAEALKTLPERVIVLSPKLPRAAVTPPAARKAGARRATPHPRKRKRA